MPKTYSNSPKVRSLMTLPHLRSSAFVETDPHKFFAEASEPGLAPGSFPTEFLTTPPMGNGEQFQFLRTDFYGGYIYRQSLGVVEILIAND